MISWRSCSGSTGPSFLCKRWRTRLRAAFEEADALAAAAAMTMVSRVEVCKHITAQVAIRYWARQSGIDRQFELKQK
eukprot:CAMPEP_0115103092 /NCGR_PEP_ID=MMETSP0227-20121206/34340_1 /TAXON_ID=89957 /ORGANISM="Polarella glacialis, Strain CCMP 1383" /LENGTH=76 /DNA_ID=CAMNT_0002499405 /DNA_START=477 /DNA_END=704 /DNA_ORIENTATION=-